MIKYINVFIGVVLLSFVQGVSAQDLIVTVQDDSIQCKITKIDKQYIYFTHYKDGEIISALIEKQEAKKHKENYFSYPTVPLVYIINFKNYDRFNIGINVGSSSRTAKISDDIPDEFKDHHEELKSGFNLGIDMNYYFSENYGFGFKVNKHNSKSTTGNINYTDDYGKVWYGDLIDLVSISYFAPSFNMRLIDKRNKYAFTLGISIGYMGFLQERTIVNFPLEMKGSTVGTSLDFSFDYKVVGNLMLGAQFSMLSGVLRELTYSSGDLEETFELEEEDYEGLGRIDLSIGLRYAF